MLLDSVLAPSDLKKLSIKELEQLCQELRTEIIRITTKNGGHLGSNLGSIELIVAAHYVFDCPIDKFIFDVGHQSYAHKILTGRRQMMENLRQETGASGFPNPDESEFDCFIAGHASTSLSAAIGMAKARDLKNEDFSVLSILGDGSLSGGMIYEALNNVANIKNFIVILNDNQMSISESVGSMRKYLSKLLASKKGLSFRRGFGKALSKMPKKLSRQIERFIKNSMCAIRGGTIFEEFGLQYLGPIDGHDIKNLISVFSNVKDIASYKPVIIHAITQKGKGYTLAENDSQNLHGIGQSTHNTYTDVFGKKIVELAKQDEKIVCITAAMKTSCGLREFASSFPDRFFDVGIAEGHAVTFAAGLAKEGFKPYVAIYSTFLQRAFDQIYHDVVLQNLPVRFIIDKAGVPGFDGKTHSGIYDISMLQNFENFIIMAPSSQSELENMLEFSMSHNSSPLAIRFPKAESPQYFDNHEFSRNCRIVSRGEDVLVVSVGALLDTIFEAVNISKTNPTVIDARYIQPFDFETFYLLAEKHNKIIVLEEGVFSGLSSIILENLLKNKKISIINKIRFVNATKTPVTHSSADKQRHVAGLSPVEIAKLLTSQSK